MCSPAKLPMLETEDDQFNSRQKSVFGELDKLEMLRPQTRFTPDDLKDSEPVRKKSKGDIRKKTEEYVGCESIFKIPEVPLADRKKWVSKMPDHQINPHKWTKYSLSDVKERDMSDRGNTAAAMAFLREHGSLNEPIREDRIQIAPKFVHVAQKTDHPIVLSEAKKKKPLDHPLFHGSKRVMPEYVVGQKMSKKKEKSKPAEVSSKSVKLDHLFDEDDE